MRNLFFVSSIILFAQFCFGQNPCIQKITYFPGQQGYIHTLTGVNQVEIGADGGVYMYVHKDAHYYQSIYKFYPNSNQIQWETYAGYGGSMVTTWTQRFKPTSDSGIVIGYNIYDHFGTGIYCRVVKISKDGNQEWTTTFYNTPYSGNPIQDIIQNNSGGYYVLVDDSMYTLDAMGNSIDTTGSIKGKRIFEMANGDFIILTFSNSVQRIDSNGTVLWSHPSNGMFACDSNYVFINNSNTFIEKVDALTGSVIWNKNFGVSPLSQIEAIQNGGVMASCGYHSTGEYGWGGTAMPGFLYRADSLGDTLWTRNYTFPYYGLSTFKILPNGNIFTGGCFLSGMNNQVLTPEHSAFYCVMNADGSYPLEQTTYVAPPDANHDHFRNFIDDALQIMLALGQTGQARDISMDSHYVVSCDFNDVAIDWQTSTAGINDKYSDCDGNGLVDTNDVKIFQSTPSCEDSLQLYYRLANLDHQQVVEDFCIVPVRDTILAGEEALYYIIMGNNANPVDSIYGFAASYIFSEIWNYPDSVIYYVTNLGTPGTDLWAYQPSLYIHFDYDRRDHLLMCRTDFQNAFNVNDTLGVIGFSGLYGSSTCTLNIIDFKAILADGTEIPFNLCTGGSIYIDSSYVNIQENQLANLIIFPNPADRELRIKNLKLKMGTCRIVLFNLLGEEVRSAEISPADPKISVEEIPDGFYTGKIFNGLSFLNFKFVIRH